MTVLDLDFVRGQFPAFSDDSLEGFAHFENAGGSFACRQVIDALAAYYTQTKLQPYYGFGPSKRAGEQMDRARVRLAEWLNARPEEVQLGPSTSQNTYVVAQALRQYLRPGDEVIVTNQDHEANIGAWRRLEAEGMVIREWQVNPHTAELETEGLEALLSDRTRAVAFTHCSNIVGSINPVREWTDRIRANGAISIVDGVSYAPHGLPDMAALRADIYLFSLYKVYGPHLGVMFMRSDLNAALPSQAHFFNADKPNARFAPAGPDHAQVAAVNGVMDYFDAVHQHHFEGAKGSANQKAARVHDLFRNTELDKLPRLLDFLRTKKDVRIVGKPVAMDRAPTVSITVKGRDPAEIAAALAKTNIGVGNGNCYAYRLMEALDIPPDQGVLRLSFVHYTSEGEMDRLVAALDALF